MVSDSIQSEIVEMVEENGNRMEVEEAAEELADRIVAITYDENSAERDLKKLMDESDTIVKDRFGGKDRVEKVVY